MNGLTLSVTQVTILEPLALLAEDKRMHRVPSSTSNRKRSGGLLPEARPEAQQLRQGASFDRNLPSGRPTRWKALTPVVRRLTV